MKAIYFILFLFVSSIVIAQPGNKGGAQAHYILQEVKSSTPPYSKELLQKVNYTKEELNRFLKRPELKLQHLLKAHFYLASFEKACLDHKAANAQADTTAISLYLEECKSFIELPTKEKKWVDRQQAIKQELNRMMQSQLEYSWHHGNLDAYMMYSENRKWYHTFLEDRKIDSLYSSIDNQPDLQLKLSMVNSYNSPTYEDYTPLFSMSNRPSLEEKKISIIKAIEQKKIEDQQRIAAQNKRILEVAKKMQFQECLMHKADSLFELNQLDSAKAIYQQLYSSSASLAHESWEKMKKIESITFNQQRNIVRHQIFQNYLYDSLGNLRIDSTLSIPIKQANHLKNNRAAISYTIIETLRRYDANQLKNYHKGKITFQEYKQTLPHQITSPSEHLFKLTIKGDTVFTLEHTLLSGDSLSAANATELLFFAIPEIVKVLKLDNDEKYTYLLPILYLPNRHQIPELYYFCNCQNPGGFSKIKCLDQHTNNTEFIDAELYLSEYDEFYFLVTEGRSTQIRAD